MTTFYLVRHGSNDFLPVGLAGRMPGVHLNEQGKLEAERVADRLKALPIRHIFSSPLERCRETAHPLASLLGIEVTICEAINEVDFGEWKGALLSTIKDDDRWKLWNQFRTGHVLPGGEIMIAIQARMAAEMIRLKNLYPDQHIALFSHGDPIRAAICYWLGIPLDFLHRLQADTGSISTVLVDDQTAIVQSLNGK